MIPTRQYGPWALVTGASSGIGRGFAEQLAAAGFHLVLASRSTARLQALGAELSDRHAVEHRVLQVDLSVPGAAGLLDEGTADLDVGLVVSNAGGGRPGAFLDRDLAELHRTVVLNGVSHLDVAHHFGRRLVQRGSGGLLLVSSMGGLHGLPFMATDSAAKALVTNIAEALHHELRPAGVHVSAMLPGGVDTPVVEHLGLTRADLPMALVPVETAVREALGALTRGRARHVPGRRYRLMSRLTPRTLSIRMNARMLARAAARVTAREHELASAAGPDDAAGSRVDADAAR